jgi:hypothetical protein
MQPRTTPLEVRPGHPFYVVRCGGRDRVYRVRGTPTELREMSEWLIRAPFEALQAATDAAAKAQALVAGKGKRARTAGAAEREAAATHARELSTRAARVAEGTTGWVLLWTWSDPEHELTARADWLAGKFKGMDAKVDAGCAAVAELVADGMEWDDIEETARALFKCLHTPRPDATRCAEIRPFGVGTTSST